MVRTRTVGSSLSLALGLGVGACKKKEEQEGDEPRSARDNAGDEPADRLDGVRVRRRATISSLLPGGLRDGHGPQLRAAAAERRCGSSSRRS